MQKFSIENVSLLKNRFKMKPRNSYLAYGGTINGQHFSSLYHIAPPNILPGSISIELVKDIKYFINEVSISSCEEALSFVRLLTAPMLSDCMNNHLGYEVLIKEDFTPSDWLGQDLFMPRYQSGYCAVISRNDAEKMKVFSAKCTESDTYRISRFIFQHHERGFIKMGYGTDANLVLFEEEVAKNGKYRVVSNSIHKDNVNSVEWSFPIEY